ncbi:(+)-neomenthol dehydrogenase [Camellia lanceoleosa]|uniref:(+)-neomenthol dehydrogenase n=1 Tax=Camellia lanceoleosa TaxID=1840588 RepID=A0ACC0HQ65_9ERIC|nr:(+)-neomenthol dehydrogenase [Camellia lanceoleosa]
MDVNSWQVNNTGVSGVIMDVESFTSLKLKSGEVIKQTYETAEGCLRTNYYGPKQLSQALIPLLQLSSSARIVNVSSGLGQLKNVTNEWARKVKPIRPYSVEARYDERQRYSGLVGSESNELYNGGAVVHDNVDANELLSYLGSDR